MKISFGEQAYAARSLGANAQELINLFPEANPPHSKDTIITYPTPGTKIFIEIGTGPIRGMIEFNGKLYAVSGEEFYQIDSGGLSSLLGTVKGTARVSMARNDLEIMVVNGKEGYTYSVANGFAQIVDNDFVAADTVAFQSKRFIVPRKGTNQFYISNAFDGNTWDGLNFEVADTNPENILAIVADHAEIWVFQEKTITVWQYNQQEANFPFAEYQSRTAEKGLGAIHSAITFQNHVFWLGDDLILYGAMGWQPNRISTHAIEKEIAGYPQTDDCFAYGYIEEGHSFVVFVFPSGDATWVYDMTVANPHNAWHQRQTGLSGRHIANAHAVAFNQHFIGDYRNGAIHILSLDLYTDNNQTIFRTATTPVIHQDRKRIFMDRLEIDIESGVGLTTGQGENPQAMLTYSDDGGRTWSKEKFASMGKIGEYTTRLKFHNLGSFYQRIFKLRISDPVRTVILDGNGLLEMED